MSFKPVGVTERGAKALAKINKRFPEGGIGEGAVASTQEACRNRVARVAQAAGANLMPEDVLVERCA